MNYTVNKDYTTNNKYLADAMNFLGFRYYILNNNDGSKTYSFVNSIEFNLAMGELMITKKKYNKTNLINK